MNPKQMDSIRIVIPDCGMFPVSLAEREGFEPSEPFRAHAISSRADSASSRISPDEMIPLDEDFADF